MLALELMDLWHWILVSDKIWCRISLSPNLNITISPKQVNQCQWQCWQFLQCLSSHHTCSQSNPAHIFCNLLLYLQKLPDFAISCYKSRNHLLHCGSAKLATNASMFAPFQLCQFDETSLGTFQFYKIISKRLFPCLICVMGSNDGRETKGNSSSSNRSILR